MPEIIRAESAADFLAIIPSIAGFIPRNSLVCVAFRGNRTAGAVRFDLPDRRREADYRRLVGVAVATASRMGGVDRVDPVIYTDRGFEEERGIPWLDLSRAVLAGLRHAGFHIGAALCVASDGWGDYLEPAHRAEGHPLSEITESPARARAVEAFGREVGELPAELAIPDLDPVVREEFSQVWRDLVEERSPNAFWPILDEMTDRGGLDPSGWFERCITSPDDLDERDFAWLGSTLQRGPERDQFAIQVAFGQRMGERVEEVNGWFDAIGEQTGLDYDELAEEEAYGGVPDLDLVGNLLLGRVALRPLPRRIDVGIRLLTDLLARLPERSQPSVLWALAWLRWALGEGTAAGAAIDRALAIKPDHGMAQILATVLNVGTIPEWAFASGQGRIDDAML